MSKCAVILAGGEGKRMKMNKPKPLAEVLGEPMLKWVLNSVRRAGVEKICVVKGFGREYIDEFTETLDFPVETVFQAERLGTGHAVMQAKSFLEQCGGSVVILNGDAPFMDEETIRDSFEFHKSNGNSATVISARVDDPTGYGRIVRNESGEVVAIVEQKDADEKTAAINEVNSGGFWFETEKLLSVLDEIKSDNKAGEYYLPDALKLLLQKGERLGAFTAKSSDTVLGANDREQLKELENIAIEKGYKC
ncbi:MAG: NTP transferase domain-containing protein [Ruminococcus sp.]|nr:NTP transferase domain-containing protein [Ruminococcus sp.]